MSQIAENFRVSLIQSDIHWQSVTANLSMFEEKIWQIQGETDLIILPEMFNTGFTMDAAAVAEPMNLTTFKWMKQQAAQAKAVVTGSFVVSENGNYYNRLVWMQPDGEYFTYDKKHLFRLANEHEHYAAGESKLIVTWKGWKFCPLICYDLRFPIWSRSVNLEYDCLIYIASWPSMRSQAWSILLQGRAVENQAYCIGVNRVGEDGNGYPYNGCSSVVSPLGERLFYQEDKEIIQTVELNYTALKEYREKFPFYLDADSFELN